MAWLDWAVRFVRPSWEANITTWNLGPLGYEYSRTQLQELLKEGQEVVMVQEVRFPLGARQRVKNELKHLHPEYHCFLETGKDPLPQTEKAWMGLKARGAIEGTLQWPRSSTVGSSDLHRDGNGMLMWTQKHYGI
jgi:hypothetical protein